MVHFPGLARTRLWIQRAVHEVHSCGFPHSDIPGSKPACGSPRLFAACHVLLRLLAPRHPPYALSSLTIKLAAHAALRHAPVFRPIAYLAAPGKFAIRTGSANKELVVGTHRRLRRRQRLPLPHSVVKELWSRSRRNLHPLQTTFVARSVRTTKNPASSAGRIRPAGRTCSLLDRLSIRYS